MCLSGFLGGNTNRRPARCKIVVRKNATPTRGASGEFIVTVDRPCVHLQIPDSLGGPSEGWIYALSLTTHNEGVVPEGYLEMRAT